MPKLSRLAGSTSHILSIFVQDSSKADGSGLTGLTYSTSGLTCHYKRNTGSASVAVTLANITTLGTYVSGGFKEVDSANMPGVYEFHPPDAAYASGAKSVVLMLKGATNMAPVPIEVELTGVDNQDATRFGLSALPNAAAGGTGGLPTRGGAIPDATAGASGGLPVIGSAPLSHLDADVSSRSSHTAANVWGVARTGNQASGTFGEYVDAAISTRSTYAGADTAGTSTLLARLTGTRATNLDNLDAAVSTRSTYAGGDTGGTTTLLSRIPGTVQPQTGDSYARIGTNGSGLTAIGDTRLANLDAAISTLATHADIVGLSIPTTAQVADKVLGRNLAGGSDGGRTVRDALRFLRNKWSVASNILTVTMEDDSTIAWTSTLTTDSAAAPVTGSDPT